MPGETCNVALVGTKFMGRAHSNAYLNAAKFFDLPVMPVMHTVAARNEADTKIFAQRWGWQNATTDWQAAVSNPEIDLVDVVTPNNVHAEHTIEALEAGKHVGALYDDQIITLLLEGRKLEDIKVREVMGEPLPVVDEDASASELLKTFQSGVPAVMVKRASGEYGILTKADLVAVL